MTFTRPTTILLALVASATLSTAANAQRGFFVRRVDQDREAAAQAEARTRPRLARYAQPEELVPPQPGLDQRDPPPVYRPPAPAYSRPLPAEHYRPHHKISGKIKYRYHRRCFGPRCQKGPGYETVLRVRDPRSCSCCKPRYVDVPVCLPACCEGEPKVAARRGLLVDGVVRFRYCCGFQVKVVFEKCGDLTVHYLGG